MPMVVTTISRQAVSGSTKKPKSAWKPVAGSSPELDVDAGRGDADVGQGAEGDDHRHQPRGHDRPHGDLVRLPAHPAAEQTGDGEAGSGSSGSAG